MGVGLPINAGSRILAATIAAIAPDCVIKPTDQSLTSNATLQNDNALVLPLAVADATYLFFSYLNYEGGTQGSSDIQWQWGVPSGATLRYQPFYVGTSGNVAGGPTYAGGATVDAGSNGAGVLMGVTMIGSLVVGSTTGSVQLKWAQNTSNGTPTIVHAQSFLALWRIT